MKKYITFNDAVKHFSKKLNISKKEVEEMLLNAAKSNKINAFAKVDDKMLPVHIDGNNKIEIKH